MHMIFAVNFHILNFLSFNGFLEFKFSNGQNIFEIFPRIQIVLKIINCNIINNICGEFSYIKKICDLTVF